MKLNNKLITKADSLVDKNMSCPRIKVSNSQTSFRDGVETENVESHFPQQLRCKNEDVPDPYFTVLGAACSIPTLIVNQFAKAKERKVGPFQNMNVRSWKSSTYRVCAQLTESYHSASIDGETIFAFKTLPYIIYSCYM